jgi:hypothetical protein
MNDKPSSQVKGKFVSETDKAICIVYWGRNEWFPKSQISGINKTGEEVTFAAPDWLIAKKRKEIVFEEAVDAPAPVVAQNWAFCDECKEDSFNICKQGETYFIQCASCGKQLKL